MAENVEVLTEEGKKKLEERLNYLLTVEQPKAFEELNFARSQGDLSENADYDAARTKTENIKAEIESIKHTLDHCKVVTVVGDSSTARLGGGTITILNSVTHKEYSFKIVGSAEAVPTEKISNTCPIAQAVLGHKAGDVVTVNVAKPYDVEIIRIDND